MLLFILEYEDCDKGAWYNFTKEVRFSFCADNHIDLNNS